MVSVILLISTSVLAAIITVAGYFYYKFRIANRLKAPADVVILYQIGRGPRAPSISPFPMKLETFLRMAKVPYMNDHSARFSSKRKTPWMEYNGIPVTDSQLCIEYLKEKRNMDLNSHLTEEQKAIARGFLKLTEENLYWTMCLEMFGDDLTAVKSVIPYRGFKLWLTVSFLRRIIAKETWGHGIGRHSKDDVWRIAVKDMEAISAFLGNKQFMMGDRPSEVDCAIFGMLAQIYWHMPGSKHQKYIKEKLPNLTDYCFRMKERFWPDWDSVTMEGKTYSSDHGKLHFPENEKGHSEVERPSLVNGTHKK